MRNIRIITAAAAFVLAACGQAAAPQNAQAQPTATPAAVSAADRAAILRANNLTANARGQVKNECDELVTPQFLPADMGGAVGTAILFAMGGGPNMASCYGDGEDLHLMKREGAGFREIYAARGRVLVILPTRTAGVSDIADGGPGFSFPLWKWNGTEYAYARRSVSDAETANAKFLP